MTPELNKIYCGDILEVLKQWPDEFVDLIITSPPYYGLRKYGDYEQQIGLEETFEEYLKKILEIMAEIKRVLKPTGQFWLNMGDCYGSHTVGDSKLAGGLQKNLCQKSEGFPRQINKANSLGDKCMGMMPERIALKMIDEQGWILRNKIKWAKQVLNFKEKRTYGSVMPTSVKDRFNESGEELYFFVKNKKYYSDLDAVRMPNQVIGISDFRQNRGGFVDPKDLYDSKFNKFNYRVRDAKRKAGQPQFKASEEEIKRYNEIPEDYGKKKLQNLVDKGKGLNRWMSGTPNYTHRNSPEKLKKMGVPATYIGATGQDHNLLNNPNGKNLPTIWLIQSEPHNFQKEYDVDIDHFAIFPQALVEIPIKFGCPSKGLVLDPFMGSGTTAVVARKLGRKYLGIELNPEYIKIAEARLRQEILL